VQTIDANAPPLIRHLDGTALKLESPCGAGRMVWRVWGRGKPLLLVHGGAGAWSHWVRNLEPLIGERLVLAPDIPGLGDSDSPPHPYTPESIAAIIAGGLTELLDGLAERSSSPRVDIGGFSFGGMICGLVAANVRDRVDSVALIGASGLGGQFDQLAPVARLPKDASVHELAEIHRNNLLVMMLHRAESVDELALWIQSTNAPKTRVMSPEHALSRKLEHALRALDVPILSIWGRHCIFSADLQRRRLLLEAIRADSRFSIIDDAGHWAQFEAAEEVNRHLVDWWCPRCPR
jgi:pimeloyl-ACP methyl ester carboxylesterase